MCDRCVDIDYPVADCWRPCYVPRTRATRPLTLQSGWSDEDDDLQVRLRTLLAVIRSQRAEIASLTATAIRPDSRESFEGVE